MEKQRNKWFQDLKQKQFWRELFGSKFLLCTLVSTSVTQPTEKDTVWCCHCTVPGSCYRCLLFCIPAQWEWEYVAHFIYLFI